MLAAEPRSQHSDIRTEGCPGSQAGHTHPHQGQAGGTHGPGWGSGPQLRDAAPEPSGLEHASPHPCGSLSLAKAPRLAQGWAEIENRQSGILTDLESPLCPQEPLGEHDREGRVRGRGLGLRQAARGAAQRGQGVHNSATLGRGCPPRLGTEATGLISGGPYEATTRYMGSWESRIPQNSPAG